MLYQEYRRQRISIMKLEHWNSTNISSNQLHSSNNSTSSSQGDVQVFTNATITFSLLILVLGSIGNSAVLVIFLRKWKKLKNCELFMMNLALSDLIGSIIIPLQFVVELLEYDILPFGHLGCKLVSSFSTTCISVSSFIIVAITVERFLVIIVEYRRKFGRKSMLLVNVGIWILGGVLGLYCLVSDGVQLFKEDYIYVCRDRSSETQRKIYFLVTCTFQVIIPLFIVVTLSSVIVCAIQRNATNTLLKNSSREHRKRARISRRAVKLVYVIIVAFFICELPVNIFFFVHVFDFSRLPYDVTVRLYYTLHSLQVSNNCINPLVYCKLHHYFGRGLWERIYFRVVGVLCGVKEERTSLGHLRSNEVHLRDLKIPSPQRIT